MTKKKPDDETLRGAPDFTPKSSPARPPSGAASAVPRPSSSSSSLRAVAPEVSQGAWRDRVFQPRGVLSQAEVIQGLETGLRTVLGNANHTSVAFQDLRSTWLPFLRQTLEQNGGDGIDAWLLRVLKPPGRHAMDPLVDDLISALTRLRLAKDLAQFEEEALKSVEVVRRSFKHKEPRKLSFKQMELELEGKIEVDELLTIACSDDNELSHRFTEIGKTMEMLRDQFVSRPGPKPDGIFANFTRLKAEMRVFDGELKRRAASSPA